MSFVTWKNSIAFLCVYEIFFLTAGDMDREGCVEGEADLMNEMDWRQDFLFCDGTLNFWTVFIESSSFERNIYGVLEFYSKFYFWNPILCELKRNFEAFLLQPKQAFAESFKINLCSFYKLNCSAQIPTQSPSDTQSICRKFFNFLQPLPRTKKKS